MKSELIHERELLEKVSLGDESAFIQIFRFYQGPIYQVAFQMVKSHDLAEELLQDVFVKVWQKRSLLVEIENFKSWLFIISRNHILNQLKKMAKDQELRDAWLYEQPLHENSADYRLRTHDFNDFLIHIINLLPTQQRAVFKLAREEHLTYVQIAEKLAISSNTVRIHMSRALSFIRINLKNKGIEYLILFVIQYPYLLV